MSTLLQSCVQAQLALPEQFPILTQAQLDEAGESFYHSGRRMQAGDQVLYGYLCDDQEQVANLVSFHRDEVDTLYADYQGELLPAVVEGDIPYIRLRSFEEYYATV